MWPSSRWFVARSSSRPSPSRERSSAMEPIRSGIIGTGFMGRAHARAVRSAGGTVVAFAGRDQDRTRATAQAEGVRRVLTPKNSLTTPTSISCTCAPRTPSTCSMPRRRSRRASM
ncbi:NAD(P)-binding domain-containing protein [Microbacterium schleiferi]|uniref:NAD(P)-binding domain-containing protein n=1 Tax=Microbacterium schleiferi TaxID=69362 RepID=UPI003AB9918D